MSSAMSRGDEKRLALPPPACGIASLFPLTQKGISERRLGNAIALHVLPPPGGLQFAAQHLLSTAMDGLDGSNRPSSTGSRSHRDPIVKQMGKRYSSFTHGRC